ncbi:PhnE/PtxC family ABC transporter permease [Nitrogeniibacter mangrovi]|uniref:PhnE/PtxC family ABC transporter permease n=1 Tax=Nitrogeniibacter mangrovi TaxID=2016596 RepID=UPI001C2D9007|nr:hypothetical protein [Nitrogeniibacter mangrovi]
MSPPARDPAARGRLTGVLVFLLVLWPMLVVAHFDPRALFDAGNLATMGGFLSTFLPPATDPFFLGLLWRGTVDTLAIATAGIALGWLLAVPLALVLTRSLSVSRLDGRVRALSELLRALARLLTLVLRGVPELVWALVFVRIFGLGPAAGVAALAITYGGMLAKVYAEILESAPRHRPGHCWPVGRGGCRRWATGCCPRPSTSWSPTPCIAGSARCAPRW